MISTLRGTVLSALGGHVVIEVGGVGFSVQVTAEHAIALRQGETALIHTRLVVREDALSLFGFETAEQLEVFDLLTGVNGVGPKSALGVLSAMGPGQIAAAVEGEDDTAFRRVSGIGPKTAKLIVVSLAGKLRGYEDVAPAASGAAVTAGADVVAALAGLGWSEKIASSAVDDLVGTDPSLADAPVQTLLRLALAQLGPVGRQGARS